MWVLRLDRLRTTGIWHTCEDKQILVNSHTYHILCQRQPDPPVEEGQELVLVVALQPVGSQGTEDGSDAPDAQGGGQESCVEQDLLLPGLQLVGHVVRVDVEVFKGERHHGQHGCS